MDLANIVKEWLETHGYDGLCYDYCGCAIEDLMPCDEPNINCRPGYKVPCPGPEDCENGGGCPWHISQIKPETKAT